MKILRIENIILIGLGLPNIVACTSDFPRDRPQATAEVRYEIPDPPFRKMDHMTLRHPKPFSNPQAEALYERISHAQINTLRHRTFVALSRDYRRLCTGEPCNLSAASPTDRQNLKDLERQARLQASENRDSILSMEASLLSLAHLMSESELQELLPELDSLRRTDEARVASLRVIQKTLYGMALN